MKQLEALGMVQYFLYEREDLQLGGNTAFLGPNGTGKTALLDAFQIVLLAADSNKTHFNASGEGKKRARTLREYCLGVYGQNDAERCRTSANTYINLVFRDPETDMPVTAGVSLSANTEDPTHEFNSLYILPGVALTTQDHVDPETNRETILPWRKFQHVAKDACTLVGTAPLFTQNREEFLRQLFVGHLASPGERPNIWVSTPTPCCCQRQGNWTPSAPTKSTRKRAASSGSSWPCPRQPATRKWSKSSARARASAKPSCSSTAATRSMPKRWKTACCCISTAKP